MSNFTYQIDAPFISFEEYARRAGIQPSAVRAQVREGRLPIRPKLKPQERPFINMLALAKEAAELAEAH
ncbi:DNA-binding protein [Shewanella abyssi]|uniref:DNA-binding protein n=1 Tax=Shewanella abyssi TaxID=311789 RepID=UPI00200E5891|nr:DNA-binding protein [Shewanella abyssi]MCL1050360.1 DNA-binding protein [Shewanella abyssi]